MNELVKKAIAIYKEDLQNGLTTPNDSDYILFVCEEVANNENNMTDDEFSKFCSKVYEEYEKLN